MPISIIFYGIIYALVTKSPRRKQQALWFSFSCLFVFSNEFLVNQIVRLWEYPPTVLKMNESYEVAVVLTGGMTVKQDTMTYYSNTVDRVLEPLLLYKKGQIKKILISGGSGNLTNQADSISEGKAVAHLLQVSGVPEEDIWLEGSSRNTRENALFSARILKAKKINRFLLVTSANHMPRAMGCFRKVGLQPTAFPTDFYGSDAQTMIDHILIPKEQALNTTYWIWREIVGYIVYRLVGYC
ncbi:MAG: YdcF family protein [Siphonobacter sp.]